MQVHTRATALHYACSMSLRIALRLLQARRLESQGGRTRAARAQRASFYVSPAASFLCPRAATTLSEEDVGVRSSGGVPPSDDSL